MNKIITLSILFFLLFSCSSNEDSSEDKSTKEKTNITSQEDIDELSVFQLPTLWETQYGDTIQLVDLKGNTLVVVMIYTTCKAACPRLVADMKNIQKDVGLDNETPVNYILISIDPETDTPDRLMEFSIENNMTDDHWYFLRGSEANTREFANVLAVQYAEISPIDFSHSNIISVFDKNGVLKHQQEGLGVNNKETLEIIKSLSKQ